MYRKGLSIFQKLFIAFSSIAVISLIVSGGVHYKSQKEFIRHTIKSQLSNSVYVSSDYFNKTVTIPIKQSLYFIEASPLLTSFLISRKDEALLTKPSVERLFLFFTDSPESIVLSARYIDPKGKEKIITEGRRRIKDYTEVDHFTENVRYRRIYSLFERLKAEKVKTILFEGPFKYENNKLTFVIGISKMDPEFGGFGGAVIFHCDLTGYMNYLAKLDFNQTPIAYAFDPDKQLLLSPEKGALSDPASYLSQDVDNNLVASASITLGSHNEVLLNYLLGVPQEMLTAELQKTLKGSAFMGVSIVILIGFVAFFITMRLLVKPIRVLSHGTRMIGGGDLGCRIEVETHDEFAQLADEFNRMAEGLEKTTVSRDALRQEIAERKRAEEALGKNEAKYRTLFDNAPVMDITTYNQEGVPIITDCNKLFADTLGYTRDELLQQPLRNFYTPESVHELMEGGGYKRTLDVGIFGEERQLITRDGSVVETLMRTMPEKDSAGDVCGSRAMYIDITQRKRAEKALSALNAVSQTINRSLNLDQVLNDTLDKVMELFKPHSTYIRLLDTETQELVFAFQKGLIPAELKLVTQRLKQENGIVAFAIKAGKAVVVEDVLTDPRTANRQIFASKIGCRTLVTLPLYAKNELVGTMSIRMREPHAYADEEIRLFTAIGHQVGIAIENARLYQQARNNVRELRESQAEREKIIAELQKVLAEVKTLGELLPICSHCKNIRDDKGYWNRIEAYIHKHSGTEFSHGICPECAKKYYPEFKLYDED